MNLKKYFDRVVLINLKRRPDRLARISEALKASDWPFKWPEVFEAIDGDVVPAPDGWQSGGGAWGCLRSHQEIFERAMIDGVKSLLILEDDSCFADDFRKRVKEFLENVPDDWDQLMLGGQHMNLNGPPALTCPRVYRCTDCERTHCYAIRGEFMKRLYQRWISGGQYNGEVHCDWIMGRDPELQYSHKVYAPERFLVGQDRGKSDINGRIQPRKFWNPPAPDLPVINLHAPKSVVTTLRQHGIHTGYHRDERTDLDHGLLELFKETAANPQARVKRLGNWINDIQWEVASDPYLICTVWHPDATGELVKSASRWPVHEISANSVETALMQLPDELKRPYRPSLARTHIIYLAGAKRVMDGLRPYGWHNGYWRDEQTGLDRGLIQILANSSERTQRIKALAKTIGVLQTEAESIHQGIAVVWHPEIDVAMVRAATSATVVEISASNVREALDKWEELKPAFDMTVIGAKKRTTEAAAVGR